MEAVVTPEMANGRATPSDVPLTPRQSSVLARIIATLALHTERAARWVVMLAACVFFGVTLLKATDSVERLVIAAMFAALVFLPMWWRTLFPKGDSQ